MFIFNLSNYQVHYLITTVYCKFVYLDEFLYVKSIFKYLSDFYFFTLLFMVFCNSFSFEYFDVVIM